MPRRQRLELPGIPLHVTQRGVNRCAIFVDDRDRDHLHALLCASMADHAIPVHAYVFMGNHIHLLVTPVERHSLSNAMRHAGQCYARAFNRRHRRSGPLWQGRFKSCLVDSERYLLTVYRYIELNPVRAAMVERAEQYRWSSVHSNVGLITDSLVTPHTVFRNLHADPVQRATIYQTWLQEGISEEDLGNIRAHIQQERALGNTKFQSMVEKALGRPVRVRPGGRPRYKPRQGN